VYNDRKLMRRKALKRLKGRPHVLTA
jgi:hypothetical protein